MSGWLTVIGLGEDGPDALAPAARALIGQAEVLVGGERHLAMIPDGAAQRLTWRRPLTDTMDDIRAAQGQRVVVLATGDPFCFGIGTTLRRAFPDEEIATIPAPSAFSLARARLGWSRRRDRGRDPARPPAGDRPRLPRAGAAPAGTLPTTARRRRRSRRS